MKINLDKLIDLISTHGEWDDGDARPDQALYVQLSDVDQNAKESKVYESDKRTMVLDLDESGNVLGFELT